MGNFTPERADVNVSAAEGDSPCAAPPDIASQVWSGLITVEALTTILYDGLNSYENHHACGRDEASVQFGRLRIAAQILLERVRAVLELSDGLPISSTEVPHG